MIRSHETRRRSQANRRGAFTLAEALLATTVLAIVAATASLPFAAGLRQANEAADLEQAVALGQAMMEEVLARPFFEHDDPIASPGPEVGETSRDLLDNIDDFHGYSESIGDLRNFKNAVITDEAVVDFRREVTVQYVSFPGLGQAADDVDSLVHVQVRVYRHNGLLVTLDRIACRED